MTKSQIYDWYQTIITNNLDPKETEEIVIQRVKTLNIVGSALVLIAFFWAVADYFYFERYIFAVIESIAVAIGIIFLLLYRRSPNIELMTNLAFFIVSVIIFATIFPVGLDSIEIFWVYLLPPLAFFLMGIPGGVVWTFVILMGMGLFVLANTFNLLDHPLRETFSINLFSSYLIVTLFSFQYERARVQALEKVSHKNMELQRLVYTVSHDLKTPIVSLLGYLSFIKEEIASGEDDQRDNDLAKMTQICNNMRQMTNDLLNLSRVSRPGQFTHVSTSDIVVKIFTENEPQLRAAKIETEMFGAFPTIYTEARKFEETMRNLISNAIKYMGNEPNPKIEVGVGTNQDFFEFYVRDNGIGIDSREQGKIFEPFYTKSDITTGSGIGLSIAKGFVTDLGGKIWVHSRKGEGSTFFFTIPKEPPIAILPVEQQPR